MSYRTDNMRRPPMSFTLAPEMFQRTDGPIRGPAPFPVQPDRVIVGHFHNAPPRPQQRPEPVPDPMEPSGEITRTNERIGSDEIDNAINGAPTPETPQ